jgi:Rps23 Pro-64 3,4-dihydroxylase Tpa1-like proline 4-hydroxylase
MLAGGHQQTLEMPQDAPLLHQLFNILLAQTRPDPALQLLQIPLPQGGALAFSSANLVGLVTNPPIFAQMQQPAPAPAMADGWSETIAPYMQIADFLPPEAHQELLRYALDNPAEFVETGPATNTEDFPEHRRSQVIYYPQHTEILLQRLRQVLPKVVQDLGIPAFPLGTIETQLTAHNDGNYYRIHNDNGSEDTATRRLTYVYYFYQEPKAFDGGELVMYETEVRNGSHYKGNTSQTIAPKNNSIVFFPSQYLHEVLPVRCPSRQFAASRFTLNGWVRQA